LIDRRQGERKDQFLSCVHCSVVTKWHARREQLRWFRCRLRGVWGACARRVWNSFACEGKLFCLLESKEQCESTAWWHQLTRKASDSVYLKAATTRSLIRHTWLYIHVGRSSKGSLTRAQLTGFNSTRI